MTMALEKKRSQLLVLAPEDELNEVRYARKARMIAEKYQLDTTFLSMVRSSEEEPRMRRKLVRLTGITETKAIRSDYLESARVTWPEIISRIYKPGDYILCPRELEEAIVRADRTQSLCERYGAHLFLAAEMINTDGNQKIGHFLLRLLNWVGILVILAVAFFVEAGFDSQTPGPMRIPGDVMIVGMEVTLLWFWYKLFQKTYN